MNQEAIEKAMNDPANADKLFAVVDLGEGDFVAAYPTLKEAEAKAEELVPNGIRSLSKRSEPKKKP